MARGPRPQRVQTLAEIAMPREEFDELERRRKERWEGGGDYYSDEEPEDEDREPGPQREETIETLAYLLSISKGAATALYDDQRIVDLASLRSLKDSYVKDIVQAITKPTAGGRAHAFPVLSQARFELVAFWARHLHRTSRQPDDWLETDWSEIERLGPQKELEDSYKDTKAPPTPELTLDQGSAAASFVQIRAYLRKCRSMTNGLPLDYVIRVKIRGPNDEPNAEEADPTPYGAPDSPYLSFDDEMVRRAPILKHDLTIEQLAQDDETLEMRGPFETGFLADSAVVFDILHTVWGKSTWWTHCKAYEKTKNGRQVFRTLHSQLLSGKRVSISGDAIMTKIQTITYDGDRPRFNFDHYVQRHVEQHNLHKDLEEYGVTALTEDLKIIWFEQGIKTKAFEVIKATVMANKGNYQTFQSVQDAYIDYYRKVAPTDAFRARQVATVRSGRRGSAPGRGAGGHGGGGGERTQGLFSKAELDACKIANREYSREEYKALTPIQKMKLWMLRNPGKTPGQGPTRQDKGERASVASTSTASTGKRNRDDEADAPPEDPGDDDDKSGWGRNRGNAAVSGRQRKTET